MNNGLREKEIAYPVASCITKTKFADLSTKTVEVVKMSILDTLGVMAAASGTAPSLGGVVELIKEIGGSPESTLIGFGGKYPPVWAAFANGAMSHCLDYDDFEFESTYHPSSALIPAAFAVAEKGSPVEGKTFITAVALGQDLGIRLALAIPRERKPPWHRTPLLSTFACAATAARLLGLEEEKVVDAMGIALCQAAGSMELRWGVGSALGGMYSAFPAKAGVLSALLAEKGITGIKNCFEGKAGLFNLHFEGKFDRNKILSDLGSKFAGAEISFKPWPACAETNTYIVGILSLMNDNSIRAEDVDRIVLYCGDFTYTLCEPLPARQRPTCAIDAKFSLPYTVAVAAVKGNITIDDYSDSALRDPKILEVAQKVEAKFDNKYNITTKGMPPGALEVRTKQGKTLFKEVPTPYGHPENPLTWGAIKAKFRDCLDHSIRPIAERKVALAMELVEQLETVKDVGEIIRLLVPNERP